MLPGKLQSLLHRNPFKPTDNENSSLSPDALERLRALGYVAYRSPVSPEALAAGLPDPKSKLEELGNDTRVSTPAEFRTRVEADLARWRPLAHVVNQS